jgi:hypothetical protein
LRTLVEAAAVEFTTAGQARNRAANPAHSRKIAAAARTAIEIAGLPPVNRKRQLVATRLTADTEIGTGRAPLGPVRLNPPSSCASLCEQVGELVFERAIDFSVAVVMQPRI